MTKTKTFCRKGIITKSIKDEIELEWHIRFITVPLSFSLNIYNEDILIFYLKVECQKIVLNQTAYYKINSF